MTLQINLKNHYIMYLRCFMKIFPKQFIGSAWLTSFSFFNASSCWVSYKFWNAVTYNRIILCYSSVPRATDLYIERFSLCQWGLCFFKVLVWWRFWLCRWLWWGRHPCELKWKRKQFFRTTFIIIIIQSDECDLGQLWNALCFWHIEISINPCAVLHTPAQGIILVILLTVNFIVCFTSTGEWLCWE